MTSHKKEKAGLAYLASFAQSPTMPSDELTANSIKRRLRSSAEAFAEHSLETAKNAAKGLENTHAAYLYPLQVCVS